jgi:hypothetical protein
MAGWSSDGGEKLRTPVQLGPATAAEKRALFFFRTEIQGNPWRVSISTTSVINVKLQVIVGFRSPFRKRMNIEHRYSAEGAS